MSKYPRMYHTVLDLQMHVKTHRKMFNRELQINHVNGKPMCKHKELSAKGKGPTQGEGCVHREGLVQKERANMCKRKK